MELTDFERSISSARPVTHFGHTKKVTSLAWSSRGVVATGSSDSSLRTWEVEPSGGVRRGEELKGHAPPAAVDAVAWSPTAPSVLASGATDRSVRLWDMRSGARCVGAAGTKGQALSLAWTPDGGSVVMGARDDTLIVLDARRMGGAGAAVRGGAGAGAGAAPPAAPLASLAFKEELNEFAFSPRSGLLFLGLGLPDEGSVGVFALGGERGLAEVARVKCHTAPVTHLRFSPDGSRFATGSGDACVCMWDAEEVAVRTVCDRAEAQVRSLSWSRCGAYLAVASGDKEDSAKVLEVARAGDGGRVGVVAAGAGVVNHAAWAPHAHVIAFASENPAAAAAARAPPASLPGGAAYEGGALKVLAVSGSA
jgi:THO complex subunit 3